MNLNCCIMNDQQDCKDDFDHISMMLEDLIKHADQEFCSTIVGPSEFGLDEKEQNQEIFMTIADPSEFGLDDNEETSNADDGDATLFFPTFPGDDTIQKNQIFKLRPRVESFFEIN